jgi:hypothetical protein
VIERKSVGGALKSVEGVERRVGGADIGAQMESGMGEEGTVARFTAQSSTGWIACQYYYDVVTFERVLRKGKRRRQQQEQRQRRKEPV